MCHASCQVGHLVVILMYKNVENCTKSDSNNFTKLAQSKL